MKNVIIIVIVVLILTVVVAYICKAKRRGQKCIGCSETNCSNCKQNHLP